MNKRLRGLVDMLERSAVAINVGRLNKILLCILAAMVIALIAAEMWSSLPRK
jgi:hypothetical protein